MAELHEWAMSSECLQFLSFPQVDTDIRRRVKRLQQEYLEALTMTIAPERPSGPAGTGWMDDWAPLGSCSKSDPDALFVQGAAQQTAKVVCQRCPVIAECLADALDNRTEFGVWGGMTERERRAMLRRHPNVTSWWNLFQTARLDQGQVSTAS